MEQFALSNRWKALQEQMFKAASAAVPWADGDPLPIRLKPIAEARRIQRFEFMSLPVAGGLLVERSGFVIYVNCPDGQADEFQRRLEIDGGTTLPVRLRFTIAHELAHTFFYDLSQPQPVSFVKCVNRNSLNSLERTCNRGAAQLLIPERALRAVLGWPGCDPKNPDHLVVGARRLAVSLSTLIMRLQYSAFWSGLRCTPLILKRDEEGNVEMVAGEAEPALRLTLHEEYDGDVRRFIRKVDSDLSGQLLSSRLVTVPTGLWTKGRSRRQPCIVRCSPYGEGLFVATIDRHQPVERMLNVDAESNSEVGMDYAACVHGG